MLPFIQDIISRFGGRYPGSTAERDAQAYTAEYLKNYCDKVEVEEFQAPLESHFGSMKIFVTVYFLVLILLKVNVYAAGALGILNTVLFLGHFVSYRHWLDFLWRKQASWNVIGDIEPTGEVRDTLIIAGHIDSVREFQWWYRFKQRGIEMTLFGGFALTFLGVYALLSMVISANWWSYGWWIFVVMAPLQLIWYNFFGDRVVDGAIDNLTGVALSVEMAKVFSARRLKHTRLRVISFGSEEACLRGSHAYARAHKQQLLDEKAFLFNLDSIKDPEHLTICISEISTFVYYKKEHIALVQKAFDDAEVPALKLPITVGASDGSAFHMNGLPAITVIGLNSGRLDPTYHTRLDVAANINPQALESMKEVLIRFVENWDGRV